MDSLTKFGRDKAGYSNKERIVTNKYGDLYLDGVRIKNNLPFALLQSERVKLIRQGFTSKRVTIKYHQE